jgi:phosphatidylserine/phosphatidylglycerophosphate/cardiolipin synthase-like enzyme
MSSARQLGRDWCNELAELVRGSHDEIIVATPYISRDGAEFLNSCMSEGMKVSGSVTILTDLSPMPICQGSTDPYAIQMMLSNLASARVYHLPRLHAKVYVSGSREAIVTSGNLTRGGLYSNYEYGVFIDDPAIVTRIRSDVLEYLALAAIVGKQRLIEYCEIAESARKSFQEQLSSISKSAKEKFRKYYDQAGDELLKLRLSKGALHTIFEEAILYFLRHDGPLATPQIHRLIESAYPDLCDNSVDRVINGVRFGKRWKHAVRTAQQHLKKKGAIGLEGGVWHFDG